MKKETLKRIFDRLEIEYQKDKELDSTFKYLLKLLSPNNFNHPDDDYFIDKSHFEGILEGIKILNPNLHEDISYYFYEAKNIKDKVATVIDKNGKKYNAKNLDKYIDFIINNNK